MKFFLFTVFLLGACCRCQKPVTPNEVNRNLLQLKEPQLENRLPKDGEIERSRLNKRNGDGDVHGGLDRVPLDPLS